MDKPDVSALIVGKDVLRVLVGCPEMYVDGLYDITSISAVQRVGFCKDIPVYLDPFIADGKVLVTYKAPPLGLFQ